MVFENLRNIICSCSELTDFNNKFKSGFDATLAVASSMRPLLAALYFDKPTLIVIPGKDSAKSFTAELIGYLGKDKVLYYRDSKMQSIHTLTSKQNKIIIASSQDIMRKIPYKSKEFCKPVCLKVGNDYDYDELIARFVKMGYTNLDVLDGPGTFTTKGGIIDIYADSAIRLDFFGDELEEIKHIVTSTGQAINQLESVEIYPYNNIQYTDSDLNRAHTKLEPRARTNKQIREFLEKLDSEISFDQVEFLEPYLFDKMVNITEFMNEDTVLIQSEPRAIFDDMLHIDEELNEKYKGSSFSKSDLYSGVQDTNWGCGQKISYVSILQKEQQVDSKLTIKRPQKHKNTEHLSSILRNYIESDFYTVLNIVNAQAKHDMKLELTDYGLSFDETNQLHKKLVNIASLNFNMSFVLPEANLTVINLDVFKQPTQHVDITKITFPYRPGDFVVHSFHGIAKFIDMVKRDLHGTERDYLLLEYAEGDKLYVPIEQLGRVTKYVGPQGQNPRITRLGTADWSRAMSKARKATKKMAFDLIDVYSRRAIAKGHQFAEDNELMQQMEDDFPYIETDDQAAAIEAVKADMESERPMDRLICGDVGFGKTEVALRAAFKCVNDKMQVMFLCPTTILAQQHFSTFRDRLAKYNVKIEVLSRFKTAAESKRIVDDFAEGKLDILIGTHRLLSRDINPKNLGLIIIDEEQRFGVAHKEQLKNFRDSVDVLTLSATPIPRTMQMATSGVRDMSLIMTPPDNRRAVDVHVGEWDLDIVSDAIRRELARGGQVYYISNRVNTIDDVASQVGLSVGEARIGVAHGKMQKQQLENVMEDFSAGKFDILVSTTIVESGIDNPNTNTLIIDGAERLGLSQMYQLKGRVGRSVDQAYAYFLFKDNAMLNENAIARLKAIDEYTELGSGLQIAMRDLEIRGAGNFLGAEQSGNVSSVGFDLFAQMLKGAIENAQGLHTVEDYLQPSISDITVNIPGSAYFPDEYIENVDDRVLWYRKFASAASIEEVFELESDLLESYPDIPNVAQNLILKSRIAGLAVKHGFKLISVNGGKLVLEGRELNKTQSRSIKVIGGRYFEKNNRINFDLKKLFGTESENLFNDVYSFLDDLNF
ncbi:MAG: transcription-repair coupling factor [Coriobacteriia bacterium]|nr:transcription-repair coupling factor [Coriobacteriia bacterium]